MIKIQNWLLTFILTVLLALAGVAWAGHDSRIAGLENFQQEHAKEYSKDLQRVSVVETKVTNIEKQNEQILKMLEKIEQKLDQRKR